ncbi:MAG: TetR/AcrR family transcriptional regulator [Rhodobacteraceae bacterium]|nr:TetR/AcrR family transcriptional regulator [Paracoccaceae bacterium]
MTRLSRRAQNRIERENRFLDAALKVFSRTGYTAANMDDIATEAGLSKPTLYQYFGSKSDLFTAMMLRARGAMMIQFDTGDAEGMVPVLHQFAWNYAHTVLSPAFLSLARLIIGEVQRFPEIGRAYQAAGPDRLLQGIMDYLTAQRAAGRLAFDDPELAAEDLWGLILSAPRTRALHNPQATATDADLKRYIDNGLRVFLRAYSTQPARDLAQLESLLKPEPQAKPDTAAQATSETGTT